MPNIPQKYSYSFRKRCTTSASPCWYRWCRSALPLDSFSLFVVDCTGYGLTKLCQTQYKNTLVWDTHITVLLSVPLHRTSLDWKGPVTQTVSSATHSTHSYNYTQKTHPRASASLSENQPESRVKRCRRQDASKDTPHPYHAQHRLKADVSSISPCQTCSTALG